MQYNQSREEIMDMRKILFFCLICFLFFNLFSWDVHAKEAYKPVSELTESEIETYALNFADAICDADLSVSDIIPIIDVSGMLLGYSVSYVSGDIPYGYLNLNFQYENPVREFCIEEGVPGYYDAVLKQSDIQAQSEPALIFTAPGQFTAPSSDGLVDLYGRTVNPDRLKSVKKTVYANIEDLFFFFD